MDIGCIENVQPSVVVEGGWGWGDAHPANITKLCQGGVITLSLVRYTLLSAVRAGGYRPALCLVCYTHTLIHTHTHTHTHTEACAHAPHTWMLLVMNAFLLDTMITMALD